MISLALLGLLLCGCRLRDPEAEFSIASTTDAGFPTAAASSAKLSTPSAESRVLAYDVPRGIWEERPLADVEPGGELFFEGVLFRVFGDSKTLGRMDGLRLDECENADAGFDPSKPRRDPTADEVVRVTGSERARHVRLRNVFPGERFIFMGREFKTGVDGDHLAIAPTGNVLSRVVRTFERQADELVELSIRYADGSQGTLRGTPEHPFFVPARDDFVPMGELAPGTELKTDDGSVATVVASERKAEGATVYNLEVENAHTYFVAASDGCTAGVLVHNTCRYDGPKPKYVVNAAHDRGSSRFNPRKEPLPKDAASVYKKAVPESPTNPRNWLGKNEQGEIYRYSGDSNGEAHFSGKSGSGDGIRNLTDYAKQRLNMDK